MKMTYNKNEPREVPGFGVFKPGDKVDYNEALFKTGLFNKESKKKEGDE